MSQGQTRRHDWGGKDSPMRCVDVFPVAGESVASRDAAMTRSAENGRAIGQTPKDRPAAVIVTADTRNEQRGLVGHDQVSDAAISQGASIAQTDVSGDPGKSLVAEFDVIQIAVEQCAITTKDEDDEPQGGRRGADTGIGQRGAVDAITTFAKKVTIGEALEATAATAGNKPVDTSDAAAIQAAEAIATGMNAISGGVAATAAANASVDREEDKTKLGEVVVATREDAERVAAAAEMRNKPDLRTYPGGVGASILAAAKLNRDR